MTTTKLTPSQIKTLQWLTNSITRETYMGTTDSWMNGPVVFSLRTDFSRGEVMLWASNATDERKWFQSSLAAGALVGPRGGVTVTGAYGVALWRFGRTAKVVASLRAEK